MDTSNKFLAILHDIAVCNGFNNYEVRTNSDHCNADGYVSSIIKVKIVSKDKNLDLVIKSSDSDDKLRKLIPIDTLFGREIYMYETVFPKFRQFEIAIGVKPCQFAPLYHVTNTKGTFDGDIIVLNNLNLADYHLHNKKCFLDQSHAELGIKFYAHLHAVSFAYKEQYPMKFKKLTVSMDDVQLKMHKQSGLSEVFIAQMKKAAASLDSVLDLQIKTAFEKFISISENQGFGLPNEDDEFSVIIHGDCWKNNLMFKYDDIAGLRIPIDIRLLDFQASRLANPMIDIAHFLYACCSKQVIDDIQHYLKLYHKTLSQRLQELGIKAEKVYPFLVMKEHWKRFAHFGLVARSITLLKLLSDESEHKSMPNLIEVDGDLTRLFDYHVRDAGEYYDLCKHTVTHFVENQLI